MPDEPAIAVFADTPASAHYLASLAALAGARAVAIEKSPVDGALIFGQGADISKLPRQPGQPVLWVGPGKDEEGVRFVKPPVRAAALIEILRRMLGAQSAMPASISVGEHSVDVRENLWIPAEGPPVRLTEKEISILVLLKEVAPSTVTRQTMLEKVWAYADGVETHTLETHIYRLRQKIETDPSNPQILVTDESGYKILP